MHFLRSIPALPIFPKSALVAAGVVVAILVIWMWARLTRRRYVVIGESEAIRMAIIQLSRIADAMDRLSFSVETKAPAGDEQKDSPKVGVGLSMFGR
jgi:hypothetical protein